MCHFVLAKDSSETFQNLIANLLIIALKVLFARRELKIFNLCIFDELWGVWKWGLENSVLFERMKDANAAMTLVGKWPEKIFRLWTGFEPTTFALPVQCSTNWAIKACVLDISSQSKLKLRWKRRNKIVKNCHSHYLFKLDE